MKNISISILLLVSQNLYLPASHAADPIRPSFEEQFSKQEKIYQSEDENTLESYVVDRSLLNYSHALPPEFLPALANLNPADRWLDIGAGKGLAILDYYNPNYELRYLEGRERRGRKAKAVAISIEDRKTIQWQMKTANLEAEQIKYLFGKRLQEYSLEELGQFQVITDVFGGLSYTRYLSLFMEKALGFLAVNGSFFTLLQDVRSEDGTNRPFYENSPFLTEITNADGSEVRMCSWLKRITCVEVTCEFKQWKPTIEAYRIRKLCSDVKVPALVPIHYEAGTPPGRRFHLKQ